MKTCSKCDVVKDATEFTKDKSTKDGLHRWCRKCKQQHHNARYVANPEYSNKRSAREAIKAANHAAITADAKSTGCLCCGETELCCLDFHHLDSSTKDGSIAGRRNASVEWLLSEIEKCVVLCSNCHRKVHAGIISLPNMGAAVSRGGALQVP